MKTRAKGRRLPGTTYDEAAQRLPMVVSRREKQLADYYETRAEFHRAHDELSACYRNLVVADTSLKRHQKVVDRLRRIVDGGRPKAALVEKEVDAPLMTDAEFLHQQQLDPEAVNVGKSTALFSMDAFIGGWSRYPNRQEYQDQAAARLMSLHERSQLGGAKASDMSQPFVDRSGPTAAGVADSGEDARREYEAMRKAIGPGRAILLERVIVGRVSASAIAAERTGKTPDTVHGKAVAVVAQEVRDAVTELARHFRFVLLGDKVLPGNKK